MELEMAAFIGNYGFPIGTAAYLMWRESTIITEFTKSMYANTSMLQSLRDNLRMRE